MNNNQTQVINNLKLQTKVLQCLAKAEKKPELANTLLDIAQDLTTLKNMFIAKLNKNKQYDVR